MKGNGKEVEWNSIKTLINRKNIVKYKRYWYYMHKEMILNGNQ